MRSLYINQSPVYFRKYLGETQSVDKWGNRTGEPVASYDDVQECMLTVAPNKTQESVFMFGTLTDYDKPASTSDTSIELDENSIVWLNLGYVFDHKTTATYSVGDLCIYDGEIYRCITATPAEEFDADKWAKVPHNAICKKRAPWKNSIAFALKDVDVSD